LFENALHNIWVVLILWLLIYSADYYLTLYSAHLYETHLKNYVVFEGSFELTPHLQRDIDTLRRVSPRFLRALITSLLLIGWLWFLTLILFDVPAIFDFAIGGLLLREVAILLRHSRNISLALLTRTGTGLSGKIEYRRPLILKLSALELSSFTALFLLIALAWNSSFFLGGSIVCLFTGLQHWRWSHKLAAMNRRTVSQ
jgi:hypothetical protein